MKKLFGLIFIISSIYFPVLNAQEDFQQLHESWIKDFNEGKYSEQFWENASLFLKGEVFDTKDAIYGKLLIYRSELKNIIAYEPLALISQKQNNYFDMGYYTTSTGKYAAITGWKRLKGSWLREIQIIYPLEKGQAKASTEIIKEYAAKWMKYSNAHDHAKLIEEVYSPDAVYANGGKVYMGRKEIIDRYAYMSNSSWQIELFPLKQLEVNDDILFEIGRYESNGIGHYVIVWKKQASGEWQACLDFNF